MVGLPCAGPRARAGRPEVHQSVQLAAWWWRTWELRAWRRSRLRIIALLDPNIMCTHVNGICNHIFNRAATRLHYRYVYYIYIYIYIHILYFNAATLHPISSHHCISLNNICSDARYCCECYAREMKLHHHTENVNQKPKIASHRDKNKTKTIPIVL